jgi:DNA-binding beta-propeller fold protein YncE
MIKDIQHLARRLIVLPGLAAAALALACPAAAQIAVSANDNKVVNVDGSNKVVENPPPDNATILDIGVSPPKVIGTVNVGASVVGVPQSVAIAPDESIALVTAANKIDPADPKKQAPDNKLAVIDLKATPPAVIATLEVGLGPSGVSFSPDGKLVLVANRGDGTVSVLTVSGKTLTPAGKIDFGNPKSGPSHVAFLPDGKRALVTRDGDHRVSVLTVDGAKVEDSKRYMVGGIRPYSLAISSKGDVAVFGNQGGGQGDTDIINVVDLKQNPPRIVDSIAVGQTPEGVAMSPDGAYVAVTVMNGSQRPKAHQAFNDHGLVKVYRVDGTRLGFVTEAKVGRWGQGAVWSRDGKTIVTQVMIEKELQVLSFDGKELKMAGAIKVNGGPAGIRTVEK